MFDHISGRAVARLPCIFCVCAFLALLPLCLGSSSSFSPGSEILLSSETAPVSDFRPSATPLFILSPTTAVWLRSDNITDLPATHWIPFFTMSMTGYLRVDGKVYRFLGVDHTPTTSSGPTTLTPSMQQTSRTVQSTQTIFTLEAAGARLQLTFTTPAFPDDLPTSSRPIAYTTAAVSSIDGGKHSVQLYIDHASDFPLNSVNERLMFADVSSQWATVMPAHVLTMYGYDNVAFGVKGDQVKPNWSHVYFATSSLLFSASAQHNASVMRGAFLSNQPLPLSDTNKPRLIGTDFPVSAFTFELGMVDSSTPQTVVVMFAVDDVYTMRWFGEYQQPLWRHTYANSVVRMIAAGLQDYAALKDRADQYDAAVLDRPYGESWAEVCHIGGLGSSPGDGSNDVGVERKEAGSVGVHEGAEQRWRRQHRGRSLSGFPVLPSPERRGTAAFDAAAFARLRQQRDRRLVRAAMGASPSGDLASVRFAG